MKKNLKVVKLLLKIGAILSLENHEWYNKQSEKNKRMMNDIFQAYKLGLITVDSEGNVESKEFIPDFTDTIEIPVHTMEKEKFNRAREKQKARKKIESGYLKWEDERDE